MTQWKPVLLQKAAMSDQYFSKEQLKVKAKTTCPAL
jgi:hypothetical protein